MPQCQFTIQHKLAGRPIFALLTLRIERPLGIFSPSGFKYKFASLQSQGELIKISSGGMFCLRGRLAKQEKEVGRGKGLMDVSGQSWAFGVCSSWSVAKKFTSRPFELKQITSGLGL